MVSVSRPVIPVMKGRSVVSCCEGPKLTTQYRRGVLSLTKVGAGDHNTVGGIRMQSSRLDKARTRMRELEADALVLGPGADFRYLTGLDAYLSERLTALILPQQGSPRIFAPVLEASSLQCSGVTLTCWEEHENPLDLVAGALQQMEALQIGVGDHLWSRFLLALQDRQPDVRWFAASEVLAPVRLIKDSD